MSEYVRIKYSGTAPGADSNDYILFDTSVACPGACTHQLAGLHLLVLDLFHTAAGTLKLYASSNRGATWTQVGTTSAAAPGAGLSTQYEALVEPFADFKLVWTNGGSAQTTWYPDIALTDEAPNGNSLEAAILALEPYSFVEADYYSVDGGSGKVAAFLDKVAAGTGIKAVDPTHAYAQGTSVNQVAVPAASASYSNRAVVTIPAASSVIYVSSAGAGAFDFAHTGLFTMYGCADTSTANGYLASTYNGAGPGMNAGNSGTGYFTQLFKDDGASIANVYGGAISAGQPYVFKNSYDEGAAPEVVAKIGAAAATTGNTSAAPGVANSDAMTLFRRPFATPSWVGDWASTVFFDRALTVAEDAIVRAYYLAKYGAT